MSGAPSAAYLAAKPALLAVREAIAQRVDEGPGRVWSEISLPVRLSLVMLTQDVDGDPREFARRPWASLPANTRVELAAAAKRFQRELAQAGALRP